MDDSLIKSSELYKLSRKHKLAMETARRVRKAQRIAAFANRRKDRG